MSPSIRLDREAIKVRILSLLKDRPLRNADIRNFTDLGSQQVYRIMKELESYDLVYQEGARQGGGRFDRDWIVLKPGAQREIKGDIR